MWVHILAFALAGASPLCVMLWSSLLWCFFSCVISIGITKPNWIFLTELQRYDDHLTMNFSFIAWFLHFKAFHLVEQASLYSIFQVMDVQRTLEHDLELLCLTGVEDKLQVRIGNEKFCGLLKRVLWKKHRPPANKQSISYPESSGFLVSGWAPERIWGNGRHLPRKRGVPVSMRMLEIRTEISDCHIMVGWTC